MSDDRPRLAAALAGRYRIERELGRGGMATVYLAHDLKHDRPVAIKVLRPEIAAALGPERFLREIAITARLDHPHILTLIDSGGADGLLFYVVPYVRGESLRTRIAREHQLPLDEAVRIVRQVAGALDYAHRQGVIHRDVKPENILLHEGEAMVADFGIALAAPREAAERLTATGLAVGTPEYMSPEQAAGDRHVDARSDVYSLGAVVYEMLANVPPPVDAVLHKALSRAPADRFASAGAFADVFSVAAAQVPVPARSARGPSRRRLLTAVGLVAAALAAAWGGHAWRARQRPLVILMDSPYPGRIYDEETIRASGTNADVISDILADLPIVRQKESGGPGWHRYDEVVSFHPDLIVMHYSTFRGPDTDDPRPPLKVFLRYFADLDTRFLIYTRSPEASVRHAVDSLMEDVEAQHRGLLARITVFGTPDHGGGPHWRDPVTAGELKLAVKRILRLE